MRPWLLGVVLGGAIAGMHAPVRAQYGPLECSEDEHVECRTCSFSCRCVPDSFVPLRLGLWHPARDSSAEERRLTFEWVAARALQEVDHRPDHPQVPVLLEHAGRHLSRAGRPRAASGVFDRMVRWLEDHPGFGDPERQQEHDMLLATALFQGALNAVRALEFPDALSRYRALATHPRLSPSRHTRIRELVSDAIVNEAILHETLGHFEQAADGYRRFARRVDGSDHVAASFRAAFVEHRAGNWRRANLEMRRWIAREAGSADVSLVAEAWLTLAESWAKLGREQRSERALERVVTLSDRHPDDARAARWADQARDRLEGHAAPVDPGSFVAGQHLSLVHAPPVLARE